MRTVPLHGKKAAGRVALVDDEDYALVAPYRWTVKEEIKDGRVIAGPYAITNVPRASGGYATVLMHNMIMGAVGIDHIDHDGLNNQRGNLRPASNGQNMHNRRPNRGHSSPYKGVYWARNVRKWRAQITTDGTQRHLGLFTSDTAAAEAYDRAARHEHGERAFLNFPEQDKLRRLVNDMHWVDAV